MSALVVWVHRLIELCGCVGPDYKIHGSRSNPHGEDTPSLLVTQVSAKHGSQQPVLSQYSNRRSEWRHGLTPTVGGMFAFH